MVTVHPHILDNTDIQEMLSYLAQEDDRTDHRPDVRSKHPRWCQDQWPQHIAEKALSQVLGEHYVVEEVTFQDTRIGLRPHTDNSSLPGTHGLTIMLCLSAEPEAHTVFFNNYYLGWQGAGVFFTRQPWTPFQYRIPDRNGDLVYVEDIRTLLERCVSDPNSVTEFDVTEEFVVHLRETIHKRAQPRIAYNRQTSTTGFIQPGPRENDYNRLTNYDPNAHFDTKVHQRYLSQISIDDLHGLTLDTVVEWSPGMLIKFDREQLHCSSACHARKQFVTIFCHR